MSDLPLAYPKGNTDVRGGFWAALYVSALANALIIFVAVFAGTVAFFLGRELVT